MAAIVKMDDFIFFPEIFCLKFPLLGAANDPIAKDQGEPFPHYFIMDSGAIVAFDEALFHLNLYFCPVRPGRSLQSGPPAYPPEGAFSIFLSADPPVFAVAAFESIRSLFLFLSFFPGSEVSLPWLSHRGLTI